MVTGFDPYFKTPPKFDFVGRVSLVITRHCFANRILLKRQSISLKRGLDPKVYGNFEGYLQDQYGARRKLVQKRELRLTGSIIIIKDAQ